MATRLGAAPPAGSRVSRGGRKMAPALPAAGRSGAAHAPARGGAPRVRRTSSLGLMTADDGSLVVSLSSVNDSPRKKAAAERLQGQGGRTGSSRSPSTAARGKAGVRFEEPAKGKAALAMRAVSGDTGTKVRAMDAFASDPSMAATIADMRDGEDVELLAERLSGKGASRYGDAAGRRRQRQQRALRVKGPSGIGRAVAEGVYAADARTAAAAGGRARTTDFKLQQLRGIFAAFDENRDGVLTKEELGNALLSLGINPTQKAIQKYQMVSKSATIDLPAFIRVSLHKLDGLERTTEDIMTVFEEFDPEGTGRVPVSVLRHLAAEVETGSQLVGSELDDLFRFAGISGEDTGGFLPEETVDYRQLIKSMSM